MTFNPSDPRIPSWGTSICSSVILPHSIPILPAAVFPINNIPFGFQRAAWEKAGGWLHTCHYLPTYLPHYTFITYFPTIIPNLPIPTTLSPPHPFHSLSSLPYSMIQCPRRGNGKEISGRGRQGDMPILFPFYNADGIHSIIPPSHSILVPRGE